MQFIYNDQTVDFQSSANENMMVNATQMAKVFGREMKDFNKLDNTTNFIEACLISEDSSLIRHQKKIWYLDAPYFSIKICSLTEPKISFFCSSNCN
jgi:hypothetical protein